MQFFESYYKAARKLPDEERLAFYDQLLSYLFDGAEEELDGAAGAVWEAVRPVAEKSRVKAESGRMGGSGSKREANAKQNGSKREANAKQNGSKREAKRGEKEEEKEKDVSIPPSSPRGGKGAETEAQITGAGFSPGLEAAVMDWARYKAERRQGYTETGLKSLLSRVGRSAGSHGDAAVIDAIGRSMAAGYAGIVWDWLGKGQGAPAQGGRASPGNGFNGFRQNVYDFDAIRKGVLSNDGKA